MIEQVLTLGQIFSFVAKFTSKGKDIAEKVDPYLSGGQNALALMNTRSVSQSASRTLISPMVALERDLIHQEYMTDLMTVVNIRDIKDTLGHFALQGQVDGIRISQLVDQINPRRGGMLALQGVEAFTGMEALGPKAAPAERTDPNQRTVVIDGKAYSDLNTFSPLAIGRTVMAEVRIGTGAPVTIPLNFRQVPVPVSANDLKHIFEAARFTDGFFGRLSMRDSGEITTPELLVGTDEIKREFNIRTNDMSGYYEEATARANKNRIATLRTGLQSFNTMANTIIMSKATADHIELELGIRFDKNGISKIREKVLANTIVIVDDDSGLFTFWNSGNNLAEKYTRREITNTAKKDTSLDLQSLMKLFNGR